MLVITICIGDFACIYVCALLYRLGRSPVTFFFIYTIKAQMKCKWQSAFSCGVSFVFNIYCKYSIIELNQFVLTFSLPQIPDSKTPRWFQNRSPQTNGFSSQWLCPLFIIQSMHLAKILPLLLFIVRLFAIVSEWSICRISQPAKRPIFGETDYL